MTALYTPKTEKELIEEGLMPDGVYDFEILSCIHGKSKNENEMFTVKMRIFNPQGGSRNVTDYIVFGTNFGERKFRKIAMACNLVSQYEKGTLSADDFAGRSGKVEITKQEASGAYSAKNVVKEYVSEAPKATAVEIEDDIPFN